MRDEHLETAIITFLQNNPQAHTVEELAFHFTEPQSVVLGSLHSLLNDGVVTIGERGWSIKPRGRP